MEEKAMEIFRRTQKRFEDLLEHAGWYPAVEPFAIRLEKLLEVLCARMDRADQERGEMDRRIRDLEGRMGE